MSVLTVSRELGSAGSAIAEQAARTLGYHFMNKQSIGMVLSQYGLIEFHQEYDSSFGFWDRFDARRAERRGEMLDMLNRVLLALARHGNMVILGRCGFAVLQNFTDVLNVRIQAPFTLRVRRIIAERNIQDIAQAEAVVKEGDRIRAAFIESVYGVRWDNTKAFDMVIDTGKVPPDRAVAWLVENLKILDEQKEKETHTTRAIPDDPILASVISQQLQCEEDHQN